MICSIDVSDDLSVMRIASSTIVDPTSYTLYSILEVKKSTTATTPKFTSICLSLSATNTL